MPSKLTKSIRREMNSTPNEQARYYKLMAGALKAAQRAAKSPSPGTITAAEKRAIHRAAKAVRLITTPGEAAGAKKVLRRKARNS